MHDLARASLLGGLVLAGLAGGIACWQGAPDSALNEYLESGLGGDVIVTIDGAIIV